MIPSDYRRMAALHYEMDPAEDEDLAYWIRVNDSLLGINPKVVLLAKLLGEVASKSRDDGYVDAVDEMDSALERIRNEHKSPAHTR